MAYSKIVLLALLVSWCALTRAADNYTTCLRCNSFLEKNSACVQDGDVDFMASHVENTTCSEGCFSYAFSQGPSNVNVTIKGCGDLLCDQLDDFLANTTSYKNVTVLGCYTCEGDLCNANGTGNVALLSVIVLIATVLVMTHELLFS